ncbi:MAG: hypothetical protein K0R68_1658 [Mycobacterium sp.]|nr:hypothetical protein [Mycobacterium sp.]
MELTWWPVVLLGLAALVAVAAASWALPFATDRRHLRPLAHVNRLTRLPEYVRVYRAYVVSLMAAVLLLTLTFVAALVASARPTGLPAATQAFDAAYPQDTMLCLGEDVADPTSAEFFTHYAQLAQSFDKQRLGLTSESLRVIPLTRDHTYITERLQGLARLSPIRQAIDDGQEVPAADRAELSARAGEFSRSLEYVDYAPSVEDVLALCLSGFPEAESAAPHRRQLVYLGYSSLRDPSDSRPTLYSADAVRQLAQDADVQINIISRADVVASTSEGTDALRELAESTGGIFQLYNPSQAAAAEPGIDPLLQQHLAAIENNPPAAVRADGRLVTSSSWDSPQPVLAAAVIAVVLLSLSLVVLRR